MYKSVLVFCLAMVLTQTVMSNQIYSLSTSRKTMREMDAVRYDTDYQFRERRQASTEESCTVGDLPYEGQCVHFLKCPMTLQPNFNVMKSAVLDPCSKTSDICCMKKEV